jgi:hypothetical protein
MPTINAYSHSLPRRLRMPYLRNAALDVVPTARAQRSDPTKLFRSAYRRDHRPRPGKLSLTTLRI